MALSCQKVNLRVFWHKQTSRSKQVRAIGDFVPPNIIEALLSNFPLKAEMEHSAAVSILI